MVSRRTRFPLPLAVLAGACLMSALAAGQTPGLPEEDGPTKPGPIKAPEDIRAPALPPGPPPPGPVHCVAEWEESEGVLIRWKYAPLIDAVQQQNLVYIPVNDAADRDGFISYLNANGVPLTNIRFLFIRTNTIWTRDYGPWFIWDANHEMGIVNYTPHYGYWDDLFPYYFARNYGIDYYESGLNHVGGNYYPNGYGMAFSSTYVYAENGLQGKDVTDGLMQTYYGITRYPTVSPQSIWHHDTWGKPANPETMIVVQFPKGDFKRPVSDNMAAWYETLQSPWGRPYEIHRLPMFPKGTAYKPYMNALVSNTRVFVATDGSADDAVALGVFQDAFAGYEIVGVDTNLYWWDAVHCRTRNFVKRDAIRIYPYPPGDTEDEVGGYPVTAEVIPPNGSVLAAGFPVIHWTETGGAPFQDLVMTATGEPHTYAADLPARPHGTTVSFSIEAQDDGGHSALYPLVAPGGMMSFDVRADTAPPGLTRFTAPRAAASGQWPPALRALCKDDMATPDVRVEWAVNGVSQPDVVLAREEGTYWYGGTLGGSVVPGDLVTYRMVASDGAATPNTAVLPRLGDACIPVRGSGGVGVVDMSLRRESLPVLADVLGGLDIPHDCSTDWPTDWSGHDVWIVSLGVFPTNHVLTATQAGDLVAALQAGKSIYLEGGDTWCYDAQKDLLQPWFGVQEVSRGPNPNKLVGVAGTLMDGLSCSYVGENLFMDTIAAGPGAELVLDSGNDKGRAVLYDAGTYRAVASSGCLGGLLAGAWPNNPKEILLRYLEFLGVSRVPLMVGDTAQMGSEVPLRLEATSGHQYHMLFSLAENYLPTGGFGTLRLDPAWMFTLATGTVPPSGLAEFLLPIPREPDLIGVDIHFQALVGPTLNPGAASLTNRDIMAILP